MPDTLQRFIFEHAPLRGGIAQLESSFQTVLQRHAYPPPLRGLLGELMAAAALLAATLKFSGSLVMQMQGKGPVQLLVVECSSEFALRATAKWEGDLGVATLPELLGQGHFAITLLSGDGEQNYQGIVALEGGSVAQVLEHYLQTSEQLDTRLWLAADAQRAAGLLLQRLPDSGADHDAWQRAGLLAATLQPAELLGLPAQQIIKRLYHEEDIRIFKSQPLSFACSCSPQRVAAMLRLLGYDEAQAILAEQGTIEVNCEFCNRSYVFDAEDVEQTFAPESERSATRH